MYIDIIKANEIGNIKSCPFCGSREHIVVRHDDPMSVDKNGDKFPSYWEIECCQCNCLMQYRTLSQLIIKWNNRK